MYNQKQPAYAPTTFTFPQTTSLAATINLDEEVKLATTSAARDLYESLAEVYSIIVTLDAVEKAYLKDSITDEEYTQACQRLLNQYKSNLQDAVVSSAFGDLESFMKEWNLECPRARERIRIGLPLTVEQSSRKHQSQGVEAANAGLVVAATETFITFLDALHIGMSEKDVLHPLLEDIIHAVNEVADDFEGKAKIIQWLITLHQMKASEKLTDEQVRECQFDINTAYKGFKATL